MLVLSVEGEGFFVCWEGIYVRTLANTPDKWTKISAKIKIPKLKDIIYGKNIFPE